MPRCTACGNSLSTDDRPTCGGDEGALDACPHRPASRTRRPGRPATDGSGARAAGNGDAASPSTPSLVSGDGREANDGASTVGDDPAGPEFTVKTAGRSLERPRDRSGAERPPTGGVPERRHASRGNARPRSARASDRARSVLSTVLDALR